jgi:predicted kinase
MQEFIIFSGLPGSGKSTLGKQLKAERGFFVVTPDNIRLSLNAGIYPKEDETGDYAILDPIVWVLAEKGVTMLLEGGYNVVIDATNLTRSRRDYWQNVAKSVNPAISVSIYWFTGKFDSEARWSKERGFNSDEYHQVRRKLEGIAEIPAQDEAPIVFMV